MIKTWVCSGYIQLMTLSNNKLNPVNFLGQRIMFSLQELRTSIPLHFSLISINNILFLSFPLLVFSFLRSCDLASQQLVRLTRYVPEQFLWEGIGTRRRRMGQTPPKNPPKNLVERVEPLQLFLLSLSHQRPYIWTPAICGLTTMWLKLFFSSFIICLHLCTNLMLFPFFLKFSERQMLELMLVGGDWTLSLLILHSLTPPPQPPSQPYILTLFCRIIFPLLWCSCLSLNLIWRRWVLLFPGQIVA